MIRFRSPSLPRHRFGLSLLELAFVLLIIGVVLGTLWIKVGLVFQNVEVTKAVEQLHVLVMSLRNVHVSDKVTENENLDLLNLPPDMVMRFQNHSILVNPWKGKILTYQGNAAGWGGDTHNDEMTLRYDGVPGSACTDFIMEAANQLKNMGLVAVYISPVLAQGKEFCLSSDDFCRATVSALSKKDIEPLCQARHVMTVMFTLTTH